MRASAKVRIAIHGTIKSLAGETDSRRSPELPYQSMATLLLLYITRRVNFFVSSRRRNFLLIISTFFFYEYFPHSFIRYRSTLSFTYVQGQKITNVILKFIDFSELFFIIQHMFSHTTFIYVFFGNLFRK